MNHRSRPDMTQSRRYQSYYLKKMPTQVSFSKDGQSGLSETSQVLQKEIEKMQKSLFERNQKYGKTLKQKSKIEDEEQKIRSALKSRMEQKMRKSQQSMLSYRQKSNSSLSTRLKAEAKKIQEIKRLQRTIYDEKYQRSKQMSTKTQKFFQDLSDKKRTNSRKISLDTSECLLTYKKQPLFHPIGNKKNKHKLSSHELSHSKLVLNPENSKPLLAILRTPRQSILQKQKKKIDLQKVKQDSFMRNYVQKMQCIQVARKKTQLEKKVPQSTIAKFVPSQFNEYKEEERRRFSKSFVNKAVGSRGLFSQQYQSKLKEKREKTSFFLSQSIAQGDSILKEQLRQKSKFRLSKIIRDTQNELARRQNFRYMEKYTNKKF